MATNVPVSIWEPVNGLGEYQDANADFVVDESGNFLVDPVTSTIFIVSTDTQYSPLAASTWLEDDSE